MRERKLAAGSGQQAAKCPARRASAHFTARCPLPAASSGFTLIEVLLAMAMVAMVTLVLYKAMNVAYAAQKVAVRSVEPMHNTDTAADLISKDLENVVIPSAETTTAVLKGPFIGVHTGEIGTGSDTLQFCCIESDGGNSGSPLAEGVRQITLALDTTSQPPTLTRTVVRNLLSETQDAGDAEVLCENVKSFSARYFDGTAWLEDWDSTQLNNTLPLAVEITLELNIPTPAGAVAAAGDLSPKTYMVHRIIPISCGIAQPTS